MKSDLNHWYGKAIYEAENELTNLEAERKRIGERLDTLQFFITNGKLLASNGVRPEEETPSIPEKVTRRGTRAKRGSLLTGSVPYHVQQILTDAGKPLSSMEISKRMSRVRKISKTNPWAEISGALKRHPKIFKRIRPGVYALKG